MTFLWTLLFFSLSLESGIMNFRSGERLPSSVSILSNYLSGERCARISGYSEKKGGTLAWTYVEDLPDDLSEARFLLKVRGRGPLRASVYFKKGKDRPYYFLRKEVYLEDSSETLIFPAEEAKPIWSSNFPDALLPDKSVDLFLFIDNFSPGSLDVYIEKFEVEDVR